MKAFLRKGLVVLLLLCGGFAMAQTEGPSVYTFAHPEAKKTWREGLPEDCREVSPTCVYSAKAKTVYLLAELSGLGKGYEVEFFLLGALSDRAYEGLAMAWDSPSVVSRAVNALGVPEGRQSDLLRGLTMAQGERFTVSLKELPPDAPFQPLGFFIDDNCSTPEQALYARGFPYIGSREADNVMPAAIIAAYSEGNPVFGLPFAAPKSAVYGSFRVARDMTRGTPVVVALKWEQLPNNLPRVFRKQVTVDAQAVAHPEAFIDTLRTLCEDPRDVFLSVRFAPDLPLSACVPLARLLVALEAKGGFTLDAPERGQLSVRAFLPDAKWNERDKRLFQPWEVELTRTEKGVEGTLCQILEDWSGEGMEPALTRKCYPGVTPQTILDVMRQVDANAGKVYVVFFYATPEVTVGDCAPFAEALRKSCPTQWIFTSVATKPEKGTAPESTPSADKATPPATLP